MDAHVLSNSLNDDEAKYTPRARDPKLGPAPKRGALCVDEVPENAKKPRTVKRDTEAGKDVQRKLHTEAMDVFQKLVSIDHVHRSHEAQLDPRLQNLQFVRVAAFRKYADDVRKRTRALNMDVVHNICLLANEFVKKQRRLQRERDLSKQARKQFDGQVQRCCADLMVNLWRAACTTRYMREHRRGNDSFRPFCAGLLYATKRGLYLPSGECIVPELPTLAEQLPQLRSPQASHTAKSLQSSSHRGLCSLHRSIASVEDEEEEEDARQETNERFRIACSVAALLRALVSRM